MSKMMTNLGRMAFGAGLIAGTILAAPGVAMAAGSQESDAAFLEQKVVSEATYTSDACLAQVQSIAARTGADAKEGEALCTAKITTAQTEPRAATVAEVTAFAAEQNLSATETAGLSRAAGARAVQARNWTHTYWGGSLVEKHAGTTFWDGTNAWVASATSAGNHTCHSEGGIAIGWSVTVIECRNPTASPNADAYYRFDASVGWQGTPLTINVGLHYVTSGSGNVNAYQVGG